VLIIKIHLLKSFVRIPFLNAISEIFICIKKIKKNKNKIYTHLGIKYLSKGTICFFFKLNIRKKKSIKRPMPLKLQMLIIYTFMRE